MVDSQASIDGTWHDSVRSGYGLLWVGLALAGMIAFFWAGLASLLDAWSRPEYSHGYLIIPIAIYLFLVQLSREPTQRKEEPVRRTAGAMIVFLGLLVGLFGNLAHIPDIITYGLIICVAGLVLTTLGTSRGLLFWAPVVYLVFMLPLPNMVYLPLSLKLQTISSEFGVALISLFGVPVFLEGNVIDLGSYKLQVAEACSGLRYLFPLMSFSFLFAVLYKGPAWHRIVLFLSAVPITILMNSIRIAVVGLMVNHYGIEQAEGFLHFFEGWVLFILCVMILYLEALLLQRFARKPAPIHTMLEADFASLAHQLGRFRNIGVGGALIVASTAIVLAGLAWQLAPARAAASLQRDPLVLFPLELGEWKGKRQKLDAKIERVLAADDYLVADYTGGVAPVGLLVSYYHSQTEGSGIHSPEICIGGSGWEVSKWEAVETGLRAPSGKSLTVNRAVIQQGINRQLVYYWFEERGRSLTNEYVAKAYTMVDALTRGRSDGALVRVTTPIQPGARIEDADNRLKGFLQLVLPNLPRYVSQ